MSIRFADLVAGKPGTVQVSLLGVPVTMRGLSAYEQSAIEKAHPRPTAPMGPDPSRGSKAPFIERTDDPVYKAAVNVWWYEQMAAQIAVAIEYQTEAGLMWTNARGRDDERKVYAKAAIAELCGSESGGLLTREIIDQMAIKLVGLQMGAAVQENIEGNSPAGEDPGAV